MANDKTNLALLIDGDNVSPKIIDGLMTELANYGKASVRRIYGDWTTPDLKGWKACLLTHSILPIQQYAYTTGKNSTDGAMIIDAMDLLYTNRYSAFCIVSSDSDFIRLAARIREQAVTVYGFGERNKTNSAFIAACDNFTYFDVLNIVEPDPESESPNLSDPVLKAPTGPRQQTANTPRQVAPTRRQLDQAALDGLRMAITKAKPFNDGDWVNLAGVGDYLRNLSSNLHYRNYGYERLRDFVEASGLVETWTYNMGKHPPVMLVKLKPEAPVPIRTGRGRDLM